jgi:urea transporter/murein DD-endopeptidase MepM/ murein hydrolase activator NlpD
MSEIAANKWKDTAAYWIGSILNSYSQIFFSKNKTLAILVILASFINWHIGLWGLLAAITTNVLASLLGFSRVHIKDGLFGLNSLLVIMGLAIEFQVNGPFVVVFFAACLLTLFFSVALLGYLSQLGVPFLSLPFLFAYWIMKLSVRQYDALEMNVDDIYVMNELYALGGTTLVGVYEYINNLPLPNVVESYFNSLAAILFHGNIITGVLIAIGLLIGSRIAFSLSIIGYLTGYFFYYFVGGDFTQLHYSYIGFNFILSAIAIGGFFFIPSWRTYALLIIITPVIAMLIAAFGALLLPFQLPVLSLPFTVIVILIIYTMNFATKPHFLKVTNQLYSPEKNLYSYTNYTERFAGTTYFQLTLPYFGEWKISQGFDGKYTHKGEWKYAWDFVIEDSEGSTFRDSGSTVDEYYCYSLPVTAPAAGYVVQIIDDLPDNEVGGVDLKNNWGNSIVIKHAEHLYTQISHIKAGSFQVKVGDYVEQGKQVAFLGNSGRSPEPHIHYQVQATPYVGSKTMKYPLAYYMKKMEDGSFNFNMYAYPEEGDTIFNVKTTKLLKEAFYFIPGKVLRFEVADPSKGKKEIVEWNVYTNSLGQTYLYCEKSKSIAYFVNDGTVHYFTSFEGDRTSLLYYFYLAAYRVLLGFYKNVKINDVVPLQIVDRGIGMYVQDFLAPFKVYRKVGYQLNYISIDSTMRPSMMRLNAIVEKKVFGKIAEQFDFSLVIGVRKIEQFNIQFRGKKIIARQLDEYANEVEAVESNISA